jgi:uncharacterized membrane protein
MEIRSLFVAAAMMLPRGSHAFVYVGNPALTFHVARPENDLESGSVVLHQLKMHKCNGQVVTSTYDVTIDPIDGWSTTISAGDYCSATLVWGSVMEVEGDTFVVEYEAASTTVQLGAQIAPVLLTPVDIVSGSFSGNVPRLLLEID